jgi:OOP family OmpA-OmpF porin
MVEHVFFFGFDPVLSLRYCPSDDSVFLPLPGDCDSSGSAYTVTDRGSFATKRDNHLKGDRVMKERFAGTLVLAMISMLLFACAAPQVQPTKVFRPDQLEADLYEPKVDHFVVVLDASSSMGESYDGQTKLEVAKGLLNAMNQTLPDLEFNGALRTLGHHSSVSKELTKLFYGPTGYSSRGLEAGLGAVSRAGGTTPLGTAINAAGDDLASVQGRMAVIIVSDGKDLGHDTAAAARQLQGKFGDRLCISTVFIGEDPAGKQVLDQVAAAGSCGDSHAADKLASAAAMGQFVKGVFLTKRDSDKDGVPDVIDQCPYSPIEASVDLRGCWVYGTELVFDHDSDMITPAAYPMLDQGSLILKTHPEIYVRIDGHTDSTGTVEYNMGLSERRARAVMEYFIGKGVPAKGLSMKGFGMAKPIASNDTAEGRAMNRRVELTVKLETDTDVDGDGIPDDIDQCPHSPIEATVDARGCWVYGTELVFDHDSDSIKPVAYPMLDEGSLILKKHPEISVRIDGHADSTGDAEYNLGLSERRAGAVMEYFIGKGVPAEGLSMKGFGQTKPVSSNDTEEGRAMNRRVELTVTLESD